MSGVSIPIDKHQHVPQQVLRQRRRDMIIGMGFVAAGFYGFWWNLNRRQRNKDVSEDAVAVPTWQHRLKQAGYPPSSQPEVSTRLRSSAGILQPTPMTEEQRTAFHARHSTSLLTRIMNPPSPATAVKSALGAVGIKFASAADATTSQEAVDVPALYRAMSHEEKMTHAGSVEHGHVHQKAKQRVQTYPSKAGLAYTKAPDYVDSYDKHRHLAQHPFRKAKEVDSSNALDE